MRRRRVVRAPASSANLGPGFDTLAAALAGSQKTPSFAASSLYASRIWVSVTASIRPAESLTAVIASSQRAGLPMRIALATVSGFSTILPVTSGAAPAA